MLFDCLEKRMSEKNLTYCTFEESKVIVWLESNLQRKKCHEHGSAHYEVSNGVCHTLKPFSSLNQSEAQERNWTTIKRGHGKLVLWEVKNFEKVSAQRNALVNRPIKFMIDLFNFQL